MELEGIENAMAHQVSEQSWRFSHFIAWLVDKFTMRGKYKNWFAHGLATLYREWVRYRVKGLIDWEPLINAGSGCTAIMGVCSRLPDVMLPNLRLLYASRWPEL